MGDCIEVGGHEARTGVSVSDVPARYSPFGGAAVLYRLEGRRGGNA